MTDPTVSIYSTAPEKYPATIMEIQNEFDEKAKAWDDNQDHAKRAKAIAEAIKEQLPGDSSLTSMEFGCGTGLLSFPLRNNFAKITLVDNSKGMLEVLNEKIIRRKQVNLNILIVCPLFGFLVVIGIINSLHEHFPVMNFIS